MYKKALIVDDAMFMRVLIRQALEVMFEEIVEANSRKSAMDALDKGDVQFMTLDLSLDSQEPIEGLEILKQMHAAAVGCKVLVVSALEQDWLKKDLLRNGASGFITKPFEEEQLRERVHEIMTGEIIDAS